MIDATTMQGYIRDANPIPDVAYLDADELDRFVAAAHTRRAATMQAPTQHPTALEPTPSKHWNKAWAFAAAFIVVLIGVGLASLVMRSDDARTTDEPMPPTTVTEAAPEPDLFDSLAEGWERVHDEIVVSYRLNDDGEYELVEPDSVSALPGGGFYASTGSRMAWSPDGLNWLEGPPRGLSREQIGLVRRPPAAPAVAGNRAVIADSGGRGIWVGRPDRGDWEYIDLDPTGLLDSLTIARVAASPDEALVLGRASPAGENVEFRSVVWLVDLQQRTPQWHTFPGFIERHPNGSEAAWVDGNWVVVVTGGLDIAEVFHSTDAESWQQANLPEYEPIQGLGSRHVFTDLVAGKDGIVISGAVETEDRELHAVLWFSPDGTDWRIVHRFDGWPPVEVAYLPALGFVAAGDCGDQFLVSTNGELWHQAQRTPSVYQAQRTPSVVGCLSELAASSDTLLAFGEGGVWRWSN